MNYMIEFPKYAKIKDNYCLCYFGHSDEYLLQLRLLRPAMSGKFPGLRIHIGCRDDKAHLLQGYHDVLKVSELKSRRYEFAHVKELRCDSRSHPVEQFLEESGVTDLAVRHELAADRTNRCVVATEGGHPTRPLEKRQVERAVRTAAGDGYEVEVNGDTASAGLVIGVECLGLFEAAARGVETRLVPTGVGTRLYQKMFPKGVVASNY